MKIQAISKEYEYFDCISQFLVKYKNFRARSIADDCVYTIIGCNMECDSIALIDDENIVYMIKLDTFYNFFEVLNY